MIKLLFHLRYYPWIKFFTGKRPILHSLSGIHIGNSGWSSIRQRLSSWFENGCLNHEKSKYATKVKELGQHTKPFLKSIKHPDRVNPIRLLDTIWTVFVLYGTMLIVAAVSHFISAVYFFQGEVVCYVFYFCKKLQSIFKVYTGYFVKLYLFVGI